MESGVYIPLRPYLSLLIFVPVDGDKDQGFYDEMVSEVNRTQVSVEEKLTNHSYYYDAANNEIRLCA